MSSPTLDERALDALRSGSRSVPAGFDWLVPFVEELGEASSAPAPVTRPALALLLAEGFSPEAAPPASAGRRARSRRSARVAVGLGLALAGTTAAGAAGVLPDPAQHAVATVVHAATPFTFPDTADDRAGFGASVSRDATGASDGQPGVDGKAVSDAARTHAPAGDPGAPGDGVGPSSAGATGLDRANETPAAGHPPASAPPAGVPPSAGSQASNGLGTAASTPAAGNAPSSVPAVTRPSTPGEGGGPASASATVDDMPASTRPSTPAPVRR